MAKKTKSKPKHSNAEWSSEDKTSLLAWLDHTLNHDELDFKTTVVKHLNNAFASKQIDSKLWRIWDKYGPNTPVGMSNRQWRKERSIYDHGSACLVLLSEDETREIASNTQLHEDEFMASQLAVSSQRLLRSASKFERKSSTRDSSSWPPSVRLYGEGSRADTSKPTATSYPDSLVKRNLEHGHLHDISSELPQLKRQKMAPKRKVCILPNTRFAGRD
jgi:hypothetical protein